jgi:hypothetical protein
MTDVIEINVITGERIEREFTAAELAQREKDQIKIDAAIQEAAGRQAARESALAKLAALGLTEEEAQSLIQ